MRVDINNVNKWYGGRGGHRALADVSLAAADGEFLVLLGPSGSGKTTLLRSIAGLEAVDEGEIAFGGRRVNELDPGSRNIGMVFQDYALYPHLTVSGNIAYNMKIRRIPPAEIERRVAEVARILAEAGLIAIAAFISPYRHDRARARQVMQGGSAAIPFVEVYLSTPLEVCEQRDPRKLYARARAGENPTSSASILMRAPDLLSVKSTGEKRMTGHTPFSSARAMSPICRSAVSGTKFWTNERIA